MHDVIHARDCFIVCSVNRIVWHDGVFEEVEAWLD
jgi:hypothetical protein